MIAAEARRLRRTGRRQRRRLRLETLEGRRLLAVNAADDHFATAEDTPLQLLDTASLIDLEEVWSYFDDIEHGLDYPDDNQSPTWRDAQYDTTNPSYAHWKLGPALFAFGSIVFSDPPATEINGAIGDYTTYLFRKQVALTAAEAEATSGTIDILADDGAIVYVNGVEVLRLNMPAGPVTADTPSSSAGNENALLRRSIDLSAAGLIEGDNLVAVEIHNTAPDGVDAGFDMILTIDAPVGTVVENDDSGLADPALTVALVDDVDHGTLTLHDDGRMRYVPDPDFNGVDQFTYRAVNNGGESDEATVTIDVTAVNDDPVATDDAYLTDQNTTLIVPAGEGLLANDFDVDGPTLTVSNNSDPEAGTVTVAPDGSFSYTPPTGFLGTAQFTYTVDDGAGGAAQATVAIDVQINEPPVAHDDDYTTLAANTLVVSATLGVLANDTDDRSAPLEAALVDQPDHGELSLLPDGAFTYTPVYGFSGTDQFTYTASDGAKTSWPATVTINVVPVGQPPDAVDDLYHTERNTALVVDAETGVLANDGDIDGDALAALLDSLPAHGTLAFAVDGAFQYVPHTEFEGVDQFTYRLRDSSYQSSPVTVTIVVGHPVIGRHVAYNNSAWDGYTSGIGLTEAAAIAPDKTALLPGQSPTVANYTSFVHGVNAVVIDVYDPGSIDLSFQIPTADGAGWQPAPAPTTISFAIGAGALGADRVTVLWPDGAIVGRWLQTTLRATPANHLVADDVFYFGNAVGETGNDAGNALVTAADMIAVRDNPRGGANRAGITNPHDVNRDRRVDATDALLTRNHITGPFTALRLTLPPAADPPPPEAEPPAPFAVGVSVPELPLPWIRPSSPGFHIDRLAQAPAPTTGDSTWPTLVDHLLRPLTGHSSASSADSASAAEFTSRASGGDIR